MSMNSASRSRVEITEAPRIVLSTRRQTLAGFRSRRFDAVPMRASARSFGATLRYRGSAGAITMPPKGYASDIRKIVAFVRSLADGVTPSNPGNVVDDLLRRGVGDRVRRMMRGHEHVRKRP